jgi:hypothetical protein
MGKHGGARSPPLPLEEIRQCPGLSRNFSRTLGTRSLDVLHVASALELGFRSFISFDLKQQKLVKVVGLKLLTPESY